MLSRRHLLGAAALTSLVPTLAQAKTFTLGKDYALVPAPEVPTGKGIDVVLFFSYACGHCYHFEPTFNEWAEHAPKGVNIIRSPVAFVPAANVFSQTYYALESLGKLDTVGEDFFTAFNKRRDLFDLTSDDALKASIAKFMATKGIALDQWNKLFGSFSVVTRTAQANQLWKSYGVDATPSIAVGGRYLTSPGMVGTQQGVLDVVDFLINKIQQG